MSRYGASSRFLGATAACLLASSVSSCVTHLTDLEGDISSKSSGQDCSWEILIEEPLAKMEFTAVYGHFDGSDELLIYADGALVRRFSALQPLQELMILPGDHDVKLILKSSSQFTGFEMGYKAISLGYITIFGIYFSPFIFASLAAAAVVCSILAFTTAFLSYAYLQSKREMEVALEDSSVWTYSRSFEKAAEVEADTMAALSALPSLGYRSKGDFEDCTLCLEKFEEGSEVRQLRCGHIFHQHCVDTWFQQQRFRVRTCPLCRGEALEQEEPNAASVSPRRRAGRGAIVPAYLSPSAVPALSPSNVTLDLPAAAERA